MVKEEDKMRQVTVAKTVDKVESVFMAYEDDRAQPVIMVVVVKEIYEDGSADVTQRRTRSDTVKAEEEEETWYVIVTKETQYVIVAKEDRARYMIWAKEEEKTHSQMSR